MVKVHPEGLTTAQSAWRVRHLTRGIERISADLALICPALATLQPAGAAAAANTPDQVYLLRQINKYLKPLNDPNKPGAKDSLILHLGQLQTFFSDGSIEDRLKKWYDGSGVEPPASESTAAWTLRLKMYLSFGYSKRNGVEGDRIVMQAKSWLLTDKVFAGVMFHEATHYVLNTEDHAYDQIRAGHGDLKALDADTRYTNADNWRIFYQKMSVYYRREEKDQDDAAAA